MTKMTVFILGAFGAMRICEHQRTLKHVAVVTWPMLI